MNRYIEKSFLSIRRKRKSLAFFCTIIAMMVVGAYFLIEEYKTEYDFGGMIMIRKTNLDIDSTIYQNLKLNNELIWQYIADEEVIIPLAKKYEWHIPYDQILKNIQVKERLSQENSFIIVVASQNAKRSRLFAKELGKAFLEKYKNNWQPYVKQNLSIIEKNIQELNKDLEYLQEISTRFKEEKHFLHLNNEVEIIALNEQLVLAQEQFMLAYSKHINRLEEKRSELQFQLNFKRQVYTEEDSEIKVLVRLLAEIDRQCVTFHKQFKDQNPDVYRLKTEVHKLEGLPSDITYLYENIQAIQQLKFSILLDSFIENKKKEIITEKNKYQTIERLINSDSCDVFIREM